jgi:hypothetical protein
MKPFFFVTLPFNHRIEIMKKFQLTSSGLILISLLLVQCTSAPSTSTRTISTPTTRVSTPSTAPTKLSDGCPLDKINWLVVGTQYSNQDLALLSQKIADAAQSDVQKLNQMIANGGNSPLEISSSLGSMIDNASSTKIQVSDDFYKQYVSSRMAMCGIVEALKRGSIKKDESAKAAESTFKNVANSFGTLSGNLRTKAAAEKK